jgi:SAM-dependent methyltransferase
MPGLDTDLHLHMLRKFHASEIPVHVAVSRGFAKKSEINRAIRGGELSCSEASDGTRLVKVDELERVFGASRVGTYGMHWGDPEIVKPLRFVKGHYLKPLLQPGITVTEIGPGGGRWTQYLKAAGRRVYAVDFYQEMLEELARRHRGENIIPVKNNGDDFPGIADDEVDLVFSFDAFVHFDLPLVEAYLRNMRRVMKPGARAFINYSDKRKIMAQLNDGFAENDPDTMRELVTCLGYKIVIEDTTTMWHSSIVIFER